jgi:hypothetical protein
MSRTRLVGLGLAAALLLAALAVGIALIAGGDDAKPADDESELFPTGARLPDQQALRLPAAVEAAGCELKATPSRGESDRLHTNGPGVNVNYRGNPPTLGPHWPPGYQAEDGLYVSAPADEALVHTMEHGRVIFWAKPTLPTRVRAQLRALFAEDSYQLVLTPRRAMPYAVAATAWNIDPQPGGTGRTLGCPAWNPRVVDALRAFRDEHRGNGPEQVP